MAAMKKWMCLCLSLVFLFTAGACDKGPEPFVVPSEEEGQKQKLTYTYCEYINDDTVVIPLAAPDEALYYRDMLKNDETDLTWIYDEIVYAATHLANPGEGMTNVSEVYFEKAVTQEQLDRAFICVIADHPELWYLRLPIYNGCVVHSENDRLVYLTYAEDVAKIPAENQKILEAADQILKDTTKGLRLQRDIVSALCGYLCENNTMSDEEFNQRPNLSMREVFLEKQGTCLAHVMGLNFLLQREEIVSIAGLGCLGENAYLSHYWNISVIDGIYRYTDVYYMGQRYNGTEESVETYLLCENMDMMNNRAVTPVAGMPVPGSKVGSGETTEGVEIGTDSLHFPAEEQE